MGVSNNDSPSWAKIIKNKNNLIKENHKKNFKNKKILIATSTGGNKFATHFESLVSLALFIKGYDIEFLLCDGALKACLQAEFGQISKNELIKNDMKKLCKSCFSEGFNAMKGLGFKINYYSDFIIKEDKKFILEKIDLLKFNEVREYEVDKIKIGLHSHANLLRFLAAGDAKESKSNNIILKKFLYSSYITKFVIERILNSKKFYKLFFHHAIYVPQGIIADITKKHGIDFFCWSQTNKNRSIEFAKNNNNITKHIFDKDFKWLDKKLSKNEEKEIYAEFNKKKNSKNSDWINYVDDNEKNNELKDFLKKNEIENKSNNVCLFTNLIWDAEVLYPNDIFSSMSNWVYETIKYFQKRTELNLIIRVHPAELKAAFRSVDTVKNFLDKNFNNLGSNIFIINADSPINSYKLADYCSLNLVYSSRVSYELSAMGHNVLLAGSAFVRNKKVTIDPVDKDEYFELLNKFPNNFPLMSDIRKENALKYAYYYLNEHSIEIQSFKENGNKWPPFDISKNLIQDLIHNKDAGISKIINKIESN
tara:strand:+ start:398 stop:2005 length:1608 start_codon:yes stop_codon:yes gene_type:complete